VLETAKGMYFNSQFLFNADWHHFTCSVRNCFKFYLTLASRICINFPCGKKKKKKSNSTDWFNTDSIS